VSVNKWVQPPTGKQRAGQFRPSAEYRKSSGVGEFRRIDRDLSKPTCVSHPEGTAPFTSPSRLSTALATDAFSVMDVLHIDCSATQKC
jgi:hypothetical protein